MQAIKTPVASSQPHHSKVKSLWFIFSTQIHRRGKVYTPVAEFAEPDVGVDGEGHEEDERGVEEDEPGLGDVCII